MFTFHDPGKLIDGELELVLSQRYPGDAMRGYAPAYRFNMTLAGKRGEIGNIEVRIGSGEYIVCYVGHIGYRVYPAFRGQHYAARSCKLLLPLARRHALNPLWITCNPDNYASRRTCELIGTTLVDIGDLPPDTDLYREGDRQKCRYRLDLGD